MTSVHSINFPQAWLIAGRYFWFTQASRNTLQIKQRQLTIKNMILAMVVLTFSQRKRKRREKPTPSLGNESYFSGGPKKEGKWARKLLPWILIMVTLFHRTGICFGKVTARPVLVFSIFPWNQAGIKLMLLVITSCGGWSKEAACSGNKSDQLPVLINLGHGMCIQCWTGKAK